MEEAVVVVRPITLTDVEACKKIISEGTMSTVSAVFIATLGKEILYEVMITFAAIAFIFLGIPLQFCLLSVVLVLGSCYFCVYFYHYIHALEICERYNSISSKKGLNSDQRNEIFVAELFRTPFLDPCSKSKFKYTYCYNDSILRSLNSGMYKQQVIGTIGIKSSSSDLFCAQVENFAVLKEQQRHGVGTYLLEEVCKFCCLKGYKKLFVATTECQDSARELLLQNNFQFIGVEQSMILGLISGIPMHLYEKELNSSANFI